MHVLCLGPKSSSRMIGFLFLGLFAFAYPVLAENQEITLSLGGIPSQSRTFQSSGAGTAQISGASELTTAIGYVASGGISLRF